MTHMPTILHDKPVSIEDCWLKYYQNNNGVVLVSKAHSRFEEILVFVDGTVFGIAKGSNVDIELYEPVIMPIFALILEARNKALEVGRFAGIEKAKADMRASLGV